MNQFPLTRIAWPFIVASTVALLAGCTSPVDGPATLPPDTELTTNPELGMMDGEPDTHLPFPSGGDVSDRFAPSIPPVVIEPPPPEIEPGEMIPPPVVEEEPAPGHPFHAIPMAEGVYWQYEWSLNDQLGREFHGLFEVELGATVEAYYWAYGVVQLHEVKFLGDVPPSFANYHAIGAVEGVILGIPEGDVDARVIFDPYGEELIDGGFTGYLPSPAITGFQAGLVDDVVDFWGVQVTVGGGVEYYRSAVGFVGCFLEGSFEDEEFGPVAMQLRMELTKAEHR
ncbi:MAG: hypothetical protein ACFCGT_09235 [Sandaracinaceae bacterium]